MTGELGSLTAQFAPVGLDALDALQLRTDRKYLADLETFERITRLLVPDYLALDIDGERVFRYDTVYFDTPELTTYHQHLQGRRRRFKCRTRLYADGGLCYFEVKLRGGRGETVKRRLEVDPADHGRMTEPALAFLEDELRGAYGASAPSDLIPVLRTAYSRLTLSGPASAERLTCDFELAFAASSGDEYRIQPGRVLLETKSRSGNGPADRMLRRLGVRPVGSCSKYCLGVALAHPGVRDNEWRRLLRDHFDPVRYARPLAPPVTARTAAAAPERTLVPQWSGGDVAPEALPA